MSESNQQPGKMSTGERMKTLAGASIDAVKHRLQGEHETEHGTHYTIDADTVSALIEDWPDAPKRGAQQMLDQYGLPNEATPTKLFWYRAGPWKRIIVTSDVVLHNFPSPHSDFMLHFIDYRVPPEKFDEIALFDGSCLLDRTAGEAGSRCDSEAANTLTLNMMHDIVTGKKTVEEARAEQSQLMMAYTMGRPAPYAEALQFEVPEGGTEDQDEVTGAGAMVQQTAGKIKDMVTGANEEHG